MIQPRSDLDLESRKLNNKQFLYHINKKISGEDVKFLHRVDVGDIRNNVKNAPDLN